jgi:hypothetical protein
LAKTRKALTFYYVSLLCDRRDIEDGHFGKALPAKGLSLSRKKRVSLKI